MRNEQSGPLNGRSIVWYMLLATALILLIIYIEKLVGVLVLLWNIARPLLAGGAFAYFTELIVKRLERLYFPKSNRPLIAQTRRPVCIALALILIVLLVVLIFNAILPKLYEAGDTIVRNAPKLITTTRSWALETFQGVPAIVDFIESWTFDWESVWNIVVNYAVNGLSGIFSSTVTVIGTVGSTIFNFFIAFIFALFLLASKNRLITQFQRILRAVMKPNHWEECHHILKIANKSFSGFIVGQLLQALLLGVLTAIGMLIFRMPYVTIIAILSGITALIPIIGGYIGALGGMLLVATVDPMLSVWFLLFIFILQQISGNIIYPRLVGSNTGLPALWVLAAVIIGGGISGVIGMLMGVPIAAIIYQVIREKVYQREKKIVQIS